MTRTLIIIMALALPSAAAARGPASSQPPIVAPPEEPKADSSVSPVIASFYGRKGERLNRHTANGEVFNPLALTAAHRTLPFGTLLQVTYRGETVVVRINDRGPAQWTGRSLDLSYGAARKLGLVAAGSGPVEVAVQE